LHSLPVTHRRLIHPHAPGHRHGERKHFFFEKKKQKTFTYLVHFARWRIPEEQAFFRSGRAGAAFVSKRTAFLRFVRDAFVQLRTPACPHVYPAIGISL
jgi:hypothetical protein